MLIKSIEIKNFRQLENIKLNFSVDPNKNVSIISGNNGAGKTTLAKAFRWCLYGEENTKSVMNLLNKTKGETLEIDYSTSVYVKIELEHNGTKYEISRQQIFKKNKKNEIVTSNHDIERKMYKKLKTGKNILVRDEAINIEIDKILPKSLSRYFFFDGEALKSMGENIEQGDKSKDCAEAVKSLLGLVPYMEAKEHLNIIKKDYKNSYKDDGNKKIIEYRDKIEYLTRELNNYKLRLNEIEEEIRNKEEIKEDCIKELLKYEDSEKVEKRKKEIEKEIQNYKNIKLNYEKDIVKLLNRDLLSFLIKKDIKKAIKLLEKEDYTNKDIPNLHSKTIDYLLERGYCLCGHKIEKDSEEYNTLISLREKLPPHSIGISVNNFIRDSKTKILNNNFYDNLKEKYKCRTEMKEMILNYEDELLELEQKLSGEEIQNLIKNLYNNKKNVQEDLKKLNSEKDSILEKKGLNERRKREQEFLLDKEYSKDKENRKILIYKNYVDAIFDEITSSLDRKEKFLRETLEKEVDKIFNFIYKGGLHVSIDEKYNISTSEKVSISTGQSGAIILSFIAGIIKMAKEKLESERDTFYAEPYPLVMDAPLSSFDATVIKNICDLIPNIAEQVIIFIKDVDGDIAEEHMSNKIGMKVKLEKITEYVTKIKE